MRAHPLAFLSIAFASGACGGGSDNSVECKETADCNLSAGGMCEPYAPTGHKWCAYPDPTCPAGYRWSTFGTGDGVAGACVPDTTPDAGPPSHSVMVNVGGNGTGSVTSDPAGITCPGTCTASFTEGTSVTLSASPSSSIFLGWSDACTGQAGCTISVDGDKQVGALFGVPGSNVWLKQTNGTNLAEVDSAKFTSNGDVVVAGFFQGAITIGSMTLNSPSYNYVARLAAADGSVVWLKQLGDTPTGIANAFGVDVDKNDDVVVTGNFTGAETFGPNRFTASANGAVYVAKLSGTNGSYVWSKWLGGDSHEYLSAAKFDPQGNVIVACTFSGTIKPGPTTIPTTSGNVVIVKYAGTDGGFVWAKPLPTGGAEVNLAIDAAGNTTISGDYSGSPDLGTGTPLPTPGSSGGWYLAKYASATGNALLALPYGGTVAVNSAGDMFIAGSFTGSIDLGGPSPLTTTKSHSMYVAKYSTAGAYQWAKGYDNDTYLTSETAITDSSGHVFVTGEFSATINFGGGALTQAGSPPTWDIYLAELSQADGSQVGAMRMGGTQREGAAGLSTDAFGHIFVGGTFAGFSEFGGVAITAPGTNTDSDGFMLMLLPLS